MEDPFTGAFLVLEPPLVPLLAPLAPPEPGFAGGFLPLRLALDPACELLLVAIPLV